MTGSEETNPPSSKDIIDNETREVNVKYIKDGPKFKDLLTDTLPRNNLIGTRARNGLWFTERDALNNLEEFFQNVLASANNHGDREVETEVNLLRDNLVFIGELELEEALKYLANHTADVARTKDVYIYIGRDRSERYISLRMLENLDALTTRSPNLQTKVHLSRDPYSIAEDIAADGKDAQILIPDDFVSTGQWMNGHAQNVFTALLHHGKSPKDAAGMIKCCLVAAPDPYPDDYPELMGDDWEKDIFEPMNIHSYYRVPIPQGWTRLGAPISGSHSSVDFGFDQLLLSMNRVGKPQKLPFLAYILRPYEDFPYTDYISHAENAPTDNPLHQRWGDLMKKYRLKTEYTQES